MDGNYPASESYKRRDIALLRAMQCGVVPTDLDKLIEGAKKIDAYLSGKNETDGR